MLPFSTWEPFHSNEPAATSVVLADLGRRCTDIRRTTTTTGPVLSVARWQGAHGNYVSSSWWVSSPWRRGRERGKEKLVRYNISSIVARNVVSLAQKILRIMETRTAWQMMLRRYLFPDCAEGTSRTRLCTRMSNMCIHVEVIQE